MTEPCTSPGAVVIFSPLKDRSVAQAAATVQLGAPPLNSILCSRFYFTSKPSSITLSSLVSILLCSSERKKKKSCNPDQLLHSSSAWLPFSTRTRHSQGSINKGGLLVQINSRVIQEEARCHRVVIIQLLHKTRIYPNAEVEDVYWAQKHSKHKSNML